MLKGGITWGRMKEAGNKLTQVKTLIQEHCVYNIISLQIITL